MCKHVPTNCEPFLLQFDSALAELFLPSVDPIRHLKLINTTIGTANELVGITKCFRYFPTGNGLNELYALCLKDHTSETTILTYKVEYSEDFRITPLPVQYGGDYGTHIDLDSPLIVISSNSTGPTVLYIAMVQGNAMLFIMELKYGGDVHSTQPLPSNCSGPYELKPLYQSYALLKCSNGYVHTYDVYIGEFTKLPVQGITMIEQCANSSSFVMVTSQGDILLNKTTLEALIRLPSFWISQSLQLHTISSFTCHWNGTATNFYATLSQDDGLIYFISISLEYAASSKAVIEPHQLPKFPNYEQSSYNRIYSSIVGTAWVIKLFDSDRNVQETVLIDVHTEHSDHYQSQDLAYVLSLKSVLKHNDDGQEVLDVGEDDPQVSGNSNERRMLVIIISVVVTVLVVAVILGISLLIYKRYPCNSRRRVRRGSYSTIQTGRRLAEVETTFNGSQPQSDRNLNHDEVHNSTVAQEHSDPGANNIASIASDQSSDTGEASHQATTDDHLPADNDHVDNQSPANDQNVNMNTHTTNDHNDQVSTSSSTHNLVHATSESGDLDVDIPSQWVVGGLPVPDVVFQPNNSYIPTDRANDNSNGDIDDETEAPNNN